MSWIQQNAPVIELGVNVDHVATLRQARRSTYPDPVRAALLAEQAGADAITLHVREDRRHMQDDDAVRMRSLLTTRMNFECALAEEILRLAESLRPQDVCLVPERRQEVTTEGGLNVLKDEAHVREVVQRLSSQGMRVSLFIDPEPVQLEAAARCGAPVVELHTGRYAEHWNTPSGAAELARVKEATQVGLSLGLKVNAGHGLHYENTQAIAAIPGIAELNIGHAIVSQAVFVGWNEAVSSMKALMVKARLDALRAA